MSRRAMVKLIHADQFYPPEDVAKYPHLVGSLRFVQKEYGQELEHFNMIGTGLEPIFSRVLGEKVTIDRNRSGIFRRPSQFIHFESYQTLDEWCFVVALEKTTFNIWHHLSSGMGDQGQIDARSALEGWQFNYRNLLEWNIETNVMLQPNQGVFFRPWMFHSWDENRLVQYYRLIADRTLRILIMGLPSASRHKLAAQVHTAIPGSVLLDSHKLRHEHKDVDYSVDGELRHAYRMLKIASEQRVEVIILDMTAPLAEQRHILNPDLIIWVQRPTTLSSDRTQLFEPPEFYDARFTRITPAEVQETVDRIKHKQPQVTP
jgi:hypothetical protein